jgi:hypothetical protein
MPAVKCFLLLLVLLLSTMASAAEWKEPDNFRGIKWGTSQEETITIVKRQLKDNGNETSNINDFGNGTLYFEDTFGNPEKTRDFIPVSFSIYFLENRLVAAQIGFKPEDFNSIEVIFLNRYGRSTGAKNYEVRNAMGARFMNRQLDWVGKKIRIQLLKYSSSITSGVGFVGQQVWLDHRDRESRKAVQDASKGL